MFIPIRTDGRRNDHNRQQAQPDDGGNSDKPRRKFVRHWSLSLIFTFSEMIKKKSRCPFLILSAAFATACVTTTSPTGQSESETLEIMILGHGVEDPGVFTVPSGLLVADLFQLDPARFREDASPVVRLQRKKDERILIVEIERDTGTGMDYEVLTGDRFLTRQLHFER